MVVLFPEPFGPRKPNMVPAGTVRERFSTATVSPYLLVKLATWMAEVTD
jgi:hypothetical protein